MNGIRSFSPSLFAAFPTTIYSIKKRKITIGKASFQLEKISVNTANTQKEIVDK